jgi:polysaccharide deacetylase 2 family uncharacterized protein YibQ
MHGLREICNYQQAITTTQAVALTKLMASRRRLVVHGRQVVYDDGEQQASSPHRLQAMTVAARAVGSPLVIGHWCAHLPAPTATVRVVYPEGGQPNCTTPEIALPLT